MSSLVLESTNDPIDILSYPLNSAESQNEYGQEISASAPIDGATLSYDRPLLITAEFGHGRDTSFASLLVNGKLRSIQQYVGSFPSPHYSITKRVIGADLNGTSGSWIDIAEIIIYARTLGTENLAKLVEYLRSKNHYSWISFSGGQSMQSN